MTTVGVPAPKNEPPTGWGVLLTLLGSWGITLRMVVLMSVPIAAVVALAIYLGPVGIGTLVTLAGDEGARRVAVRRRRRRARSRAGGHPEPA